MSKKILVLNGSPRPHGNTAALIDAFIAGAQEAGHSVTRFDLQKMNIHPCLGCLGGGKNPDSPCTQKDDMYHIYPAYKEADILVFASPMYYWSISAQLKAALDRLFAVTEIDPDYRTPSKECRLLMAAEGDSDDNWEPVLHYYASLLRHLGWKDGGKVLAGGVMKAGDIKGKPALKEARDLGAAIR
ncbi:MAG TPA: flavodoxin family protein [Candidatus Bilophila faecipullorum]|uniref:Flavodoxin family protein n=1 Tax=Candidatus Bilophila faecipullorum TaxID=2838482 RepID=A0A9D1R375_9BACT|nr:flavodoxin family protein [uncultured Bilophila sp.]HIW79286.1 flavodoxin family protein [Candidatus Bilophila faecipullorum]